MSKPQFLRRLAGWTRRPSAAPAETAENAYGQPLSRAEIRAGAHRDFVGGMWEEIGSLQFAFLQKQGLAPGHRLADIGCGCLRGGVHFVPYLEKGRYCGIDLNASLLEAGKQELLKNAANAGKEPDLRVTDRFELAQFGVRFDYALAVSVFTHLYANHIGRCLVEVKNVLAPQGKFFATFFEAPAPLHLNPIAHTPGQVVTYLDRDPFHYSFSEMETLARFAGLSVKLIGDWGHPRDQRMLCFTTASRPG